MDIEGEPVIARLFRFTRQSPQYEVGHLHRVTSIEQMLSAHPGLFVTGSGFRSIGIPDTIADARETATRAAEFGKAAWDNTPLIRRIVELRSELARRQAQRDAEAGQ